MLVQPYSETRPLTGLLRRLLADGVPIADVQAELDRMIARGEIEILQNRHLRLPAKWRLAVLPDGRLLIETDDPDHPLDPNQFLYRERLPPPSSPPTPVVVRSQRLAAQLAGKKTAAESEPQRLSENPESPASPKPPAVAEPRTIVKGAHKSPAEKIADATQLIASVEAYREQHQNASQEEAFKALHRGLGHASTNAMKMAFYRARELLAKK